MIKCGTVLKCSSHYSRFRSIYLENINHVLTPSMASSVEPFLIPVKQQYGTVFLLGSHPTLWVVAVLRVYVMFCRSVLRTSFFRTSLEYVNLSLDPYFPVQYQNIILL